MRHRLFMVPVGTNVGLASVSMGLVCALKGQGIEAELFNPLAESALDIEHLLSRGKGEEILESIIYQLDKHRFLQKNVLVIQGFIPFLSLNDAIYKALNADVIFVSAPGGMSPQKLKKQIEIAAQPYGGIHSSKVIGCMINKIGAPKSVICYDNYENRDTTDDFRSIFDGSTFKVLGCFPWEQRLAAPTVDAVADHLQAKVWCLEKPCTHCIKYWVIAAATIEKIASLLKPDTMVVTSSDRIDVMITACISYLNGIKLAGLLVTEKEDLSENVVQLCRRAVEEGLPILITKSTILHTINSLNNISVKRSGIKNHIASYIDQKWIKELSVTQRAYDLSPSLFRYQLIKKGCEANKQIVLPEGEEPRIIQAAMQCIKKGMVPPLLLGNSEKINQIAKNHNITLHSAIKVLDPEPLRSHYLPLLLRLRKHKGITEEDAKRYLKSNIVIGTLLLFEGKVDGLVGGAVHTTAETIRPALELIKTKDHNIKASSIFFMCLQKQVMIYGDCAINQSPTTSELATIAIQCADTAKRFGIPVRVAMMSYSTGMSGSGKDVEKVQASTELVREWRPDISVCGPIQYDAACCRDVAKTKMCNNPVAGQATVCVFPDLNVGNITYKAVQRSANVLAIGPIMQGLNKPVNDISRGADVEDIFCIIAITAIQASKNFS